VEIGAAVHRSVPQPRLRSSGSEGYSRHRPEFTALYAVVRDNLETLYGAIADGALAVRVPKHARRELEAYLGCGIPCWRGFARFRCRDCGESRIVAFTCKGRGFCPSCLGRRMCSTAANLMEYVLPPESGLRQWVLTFPFAWRATLARDGALLGSLTRIFEQTVQSFYAHRARLEGHAGAKTGSVAVLQRTSADLRLNPHVHAVFLDGARYEQGDELAFTGLGHLRTSEVGEVLARTIRRTGRHLRRPGLLREDPDEEHDAEANLAASAVSGQVPPAGPQWHVRLAPIERHPLAYDKPLCASQGGFTLHAATRAGALDVSGREALLRYVLRPPVAQDKIEPQSDGLSASSSRGPTPTAPSPSISTRSPCSPDWQRACLRHATTPSVTQACWQPPVHGARASHPAPNKGMARSASPATGRGPNSSPAPSASTPWPVPPARGG
jgi:hypothetical protein